jgi:hypothetical protein
MPQDAARDNSSLSRPRLAAWLLLGGLWLATMGAVVRAEIFGRRESADMRALVDSARLARTHASAVHAIRFGSATVGHLRSTVSGGQHEEQLAYLLEGQLTLVQPVRLKGVVLAGWDRRPQRLVLEATLGADRHRLDGTLRPDPASGGALFELRYVPPLPSGAATREFEWVLPEAPVLAPGPLPIPEFLTGAGLGADGASGENPAAPISREGSMLDPMTGAPTTWRLASSRIETLLIAGRPRDARRHDIKVGAWEGRAWTEATGFPLRLELPGGLVIELVEERR